MDNYEETQRKGRRIVAFLLIVTVGLVLWFIGRTLLKKDTPQKTVYFGPSVPAEVEDTQGTKNADDAEGAKGAENAIEYPLLDSIPTATIK